VTRPSNPEPATPGPSSSPRKSVVRSDDPPLKVDITRKGTSSRRAQQDARNRIPFDQLSGNQITRVNAVLAQTSMFRRLPQIDFDAEPEVYSWFTRNPEVAVGIWRVLKISEFALTPTDSNVWMGQAQDGSRGRIEVLNRTDTSQLLLCQGEYKTPLLPRPIQAVALMHLQTQFTRNDSGQGHLTHGLDLFVAFPSQAVETVARVISPVSHMIADRNFRELSLFVRFMSVAMQRQPGWVEQVSTRLNGITPAQKDEMLNMSARIFIANRKRTLHSKGVKQATLDEITSPLKSPPGSR
ncbi:MAG: hypothetical protein VB858_07975, partial [Planctomycetaceae bacterium]